MVKKIAEKTAGVTLDGFVPRPKVFDGQTPQTPNPKSTHVEGKKFTGVGMFMDSMTGKSEVSKELAAAQFQLDDATKKLAEFDGATLMKSLDPKTIRRSEWANRNELEFSTSDFQKLKDLIANAGGNEQPIKVRAVQGVFDGQTGTDEGEVFDGQTPTYEIVFGHRRHQACLELGLLVNAVVIKDMDENTLFKAMDHENRGRKNLSAWEQGKTYDKALKKDLYPSLRKLVEALGINLSDASRSVKLAQLPDSIIDAFPTPLDIQVRWATPLTKALEKNPDTVMARAKEIRKDRGQMTATEVFDRLVGNDQKSASNEIQILAAGKKAATFRTGPKGRAVIEFEADAMPKSKHAALAKLIEGFLKNL